MPATTAERQSKRRQKLNEIAQAAGYKTWGKFETETIKKGQIEMKNTMIIKAVEQNGKIILVDETGNQAQEGFPYNSKIEAYNAASQLWPANSSWKGCMTHEGYRINIE